MKITAIDDEFIEESFKRIARGIIEEDPNTDYSFILDGLCGKDVSGIDMSNLSEENFRRLTFDSRTIFSSEQIKKFHPEKILEEGKKFSKGMQKLHERGINGKGATIGIIDGCFNSENAEFDGRVKKHIVFEKINEVISCRELRGNDDDSHHGKTTASLAAGRECGVAPEAEMYLFGIGEGTPWNEAKEAILRYIADNHIKLDIISMSADTETSKKSQQILDKLEEEGTVFLDSSKFWKDFTWGRTDDDNIFLDELMKSMAEKTYDENSRAGKVLKRIPSAILVPSTGRTSLQIENKGFKYNGSVCGASFVIPQIAGLFAVARQVQPEITYDEFIETIRNNERLNSEGMMYVDVEEMVSKIEERKIIESISDNGIGIGIGIGEINKATGEIRELLEKNKENYSEIYEN